MPDDMTFNMYLQQLDEPKEAGKGTETNSAPVNIQAEVCCLTSRLPWKLSTHESQTPQRPSRIKDIRKVYYKKKKIPTKIDDETTEFLKKKLDLKLQVVF